jgi:hypothetical protein
VVSRISFEKKPQLFVVYLEYYMDVVYLIDMIRNFTEPYMKSGRIVTDRGKIACHYLKTWFIFDLYAFYPLAYMRYISKWEDGGKDNLKNLLE